MTETHKPPRTSDYGNEDSHGQSAGRPCRQLTRNSDSSNIRQHHYSRPHRRRARALAPARRPRAERPISAGAPRSCRQIFQCRDSSHHVRTAAAGIRSATRIMQSRSVRPPLLHQGGRQHSPGQKRPRNVSLLAHGSRLATGRPNVRKVRCTSRCTIPHRRPEWRGPRVPAAQTPSQHREHGLSPGSRSA